mmetsp:Transcript_8707/g.23406  ORF Transcript_8707/g.23406 Transcript_8707/m.23406 type:complete len:83 (-) Transcript_8707:440-688(-)
MTSQYQVTTSVSSQLQLVQEPGQLLGLRVSAVLPGQQVNGLLHTSPSVLGVRGALRQLIQELKAPLQLMLACTSCARESTWT